MNPIFGDLRAAVLTAWHDAALRDADAATPAAADLLWTWIATNHRSNQELWALEDAARRRDVAAEEIAATKRAIDVRNQRRNDAVENVDEILLARIADRPAQPDAWHNSETAGAIVDRLSILALKRLHMGMEAVRGDATAAHRAACTTKLERLSAQRDDLGRCLDALLDGAEQGRAFWRVYRQFKMYNDPTLNPEIYRRL